VVAAALQVFAPVPVQAAHYPVALFKKYPSLQVKCIKFVPAATPVPNFKQDPPF
jgi:hypothetical protein